MFLLSHVQAKLISGWAALSRPVGCSLGYLHQEGTWSTSGYHCPGQKNAAENISTKIVCCLNNRKGGHWIHISHWTCLYFGFRLSTICCSQNELYVLWCSYMMATGTWLWKTTSKLMLKAVTSKEILLAEEAQRRLSKVNKKGNVPYFSTRQQTFKERLILKVFFPPQQKLLCLTLSGDLTLCQPFRGHFRFFNMKPSCLSGLWTLLWPIFSPSMISQLSAS